MEIYTNNIFVVNNKNNKEIFDQFVEKYQEKFGLSFSFDFQESGEAFCSEMNDELSTYSDIEHFMRELTIYIKNNCIDNFYASVNGEEKNYSCSMSDFYYRIIIDNDMITLESTDCYDLLTNDSYEDYEEYLEEYEDSDLIISEEDFYTYVEFYRTEEEIFYNELPPFTTKIEEKFK